MAKPEKLFRATVRDRRIVCQTLGVPLFGHTGWAKPVTKLSLFDPLATWIFLPDDPAIAKTREGAWAFWERQQLLIPEIGY